MPENLQKRKLYKIFTIFYINLKETGEHTSGQVTIYLLFKKYFTQKSVSNSEKMVQSRLL